MKNFFMDNNVVPFLLSVLFITLKLTGHIAWSWIWVLSPIWIWFVYLVTFMIIFVSKWKDADLQIIKYAFSYIQKIELPSAEIEAIRSICCHKNKGGKEDIKKAIHYLNMVIKRDYVESEIAKIN